MENMSLSFNMSFKKETEKAVTVSERLDTNYCQVQN